MSREKLTIYTDGAARGNPGPGGAGVYIEGPGGDVVSQDFEYLGEVTNNVAEYRALLLGLERAQALGAKRIEVRADSELMVKQLRGEYRVRNPTLRKLFDRARALENGFDAIEYTHVRRELNGDADRLANHAIDAHRAS